MVSCSSVPPISFTRSKQMALNNVSGFRKNARTLPKLPLSFRGIIISCGEGGDCGGEEGSVRVISRIAVFIRFEFMVGRGGVMGSEIGGGLVRDAREGVGKATSSSERKLCDFFCELQKREIKGKNL